MFCLWLYLKDVLRKGGGKANSTMDTTCTSAAENTTLSGQDKKLAWRRVKKVLSLQWRSIVLTTLVIIESVYFGVVFIHNTSIADRLSGSQDQRQEILSWAYYLIANGGRKEGCTPLANLLDLSEDSIVASFTMTAVRSPQPLLPWI